MELIKKDRKHTKSEPEPKLHKQLTVRTAYKCVRITVHNCHTQYSTD